MLLCRVKTLSICETLVSVIKCFLFSYVCFQPPISPSACIVSLSVAYRSLRDEVPNLCPNFIWRWNWAYNVIFILVTYHDLLVVIMWHCWLWEQTTAACRQLQEEINTSRDPRLWRRLGSVIKICVWITSWADVFVTEVNLTKKDNKILFQTNSIVL